MVFEGVEQDHLNADFFLFACLSVGASSSGLAMMLRLWLSSFRTTNNMAADSHRNKKWNINSCKNANSFIFITKYWRMVDQRKKIECNSIKSHCFVLFFHRIFFLKKKRERKLIFVKEVVRFPWRVDGRNRMRLLF